MRQIALPVILTCCKLVSLGQINFAFLGSKAGTLKVQIKLTKVETTPDCGVIAWTAAQKFELLKNGISSVPKKYIIVLQHCPEFLGRAFFVQGKVYEAVLVTATDDKAAMNSHRNEKLPIYWCNQIRAI